jgi:putative transposase
MIVTYRYRVRDKHAAELNRQARAVNFVWNFCNNTQKTALARGAKWPTAFDLINLATGTSEALGLSSGSIGSICRQYVASRQAAHKRFLRYRGSRSLGWVPVRGESVRWVGGRVVFRGDAYSLWVSRGIPDGATICDRTNFSADARGRWHLNLVLEVGAREPRNEVSCVGIDLGLKALATTSDGGSIAAPQFYRRTQERLAGAQRAGHKRKARALHAKVANQRRDFLHKASTSLVCRYDLIAVGNVSPSKLAKTKMAKSVLDAGWASFRNMLRYKAIAHGARYVEVNEKLTTQTCSECGSLGGPKGRQGLVIREWACGGCGVVHDRDVNSARNILGLGRQAPVQEAAARRARRRQPLSASQPQGAR